MGTGENEQLDRTVLEACSRAGIRGDNAFLVKDLMRRSPATWPACCGNDCSPCAEDLICAALTAKKLLAEAEQVEQVEQPAQARASSAEAKRANHGR